MTHDTIRAAKEAADEYRKHADSWVFEVYKLPSGKYAWYMISRLAPVPPEGSVKVAHRKPRQDWQHINVAAAALKAGEA